MDQVELAALKRNTYEMRKLALEMGKSNRSGAHFGAGLSAMEIFSCLYGGVLHYKPGYTVQERDILVVGKGHCVLAYYAALAVYGYIDRSLLEQFDKDGSILQGHPLFNEDIGIEFSSGSLGLALSQGVGVALSRKKKRQDSQVYVLLGDGECQEGAVWEAAMSAAHYKLDNLMVIVDRNQLQYDGDTEQIMALGGFADKWKSFGFETYEVDGNDIEELFPILEKGKENQTGKPVCVIAKTIKGKGVSFMEGNKAWHNHRLSDTQYLEALQELEERYGM